MDLLLISAFGEALVVVLKKLLEENIGDPLLKKSLEPLQRWLTRGYDQAKDDARLNLAVGAAIADVSNNLSENEWKQYRFVTALETIKSSPKLAAQVAATAIGMTSESPERVPLQLLDGLKLDRDRRPAFAKFLFCLRKQLALQDDFRAGIEYADRLDQRGLLGNLSSVIYHQMEIYEAILTDRRLIIDDERALRDYLNQVRIESQLIPLPITKQHIHGARVDAESNEIFVPLTLRDWEGSHSENETEHEVTKPATFGEIFNRYPCFLLKGPPGCGKTTLLRRAALSFASGSAPADLGWEGPPLLPIFLRLRNFGVFLTKNHGRFIGPAHGALIAFLENHFGEEYRLKLSPGFFDRCLQEGRCLVLLDGLDEVAVDRPGVAQFVSAFIQEFGKYENRFGLASRPKGYDAVEYYLRRAEPAVVEVNPLDSDGIRQLIENLFLILEPNPLLRAKDVVDLPQVILSSPKLKQIAGTPLFCVALALVYKYHGARLPQQRVEVYSQIVDWLLGLWKATDQGLADAHKLASEDGTGTVFTEIFDAVTLKKRRLGHLALWMQQKRISDVAEGQAKEVLSEYLRSKEGKESDIAQEWAVNFLRNAHEFSGLFVETEAERYSFTHQGFREYLAATALKNKREKDFISLIRTHATDDWWEEVILLAGALRELSDELRGHLIEVLLARATDTTLLPDKRHICLLMAGQCAADMAGLLSDPQRRQVVKKLYKTMIQKNLDPKKRLQAGEVLDALGWFPDDLDEFVLVPGLEGFWLSKYPVTNLQYLRFLVSPDYAEPELWSSVYGFDATGQPLRDVGKQAWEWFTDNGGQGRRPDFWDDTYFGASRRLFPVVGLSWYEAAAYCAWLSRHPEKSKLPISGNLSFRLPLESEWISAAGGKADDCYPWQKLHTVVTPQTICMYANTYESGLQRTTPVSMYLDGKSLTGIMDLSGNVWEWQANQHSEGKLEFALRGGAWSNSMDAANVEMRIGEIPNNCGNSCGFRVLVHTVNQGNSVLKIRD